MRLIRFKQISAFALVMTVLAVSALAQNQAPPGQTLGDFEMNVRGLGVHTGFSIDPELVWLGVHTFAGPVGRPNLWVRPGVDFAIGELSRLVSMDLDGIFFFDTRDDDWNVYAGGGLAVQLNRRSLQDRARGVDFVDWDQEIGINLLLGVTRPNGFLGELKVGAYGATGIKVMAGYTF